MTDKDVDRAIVRQLVSAGNLVSGLGKHGLASQLWALANKIRARLQVGEEGSNDD